MAERRAFCATFSSSGMLLPRGRPSLTMLRLIAFGSIDAACVLLGGAYKLYGFFRQQQDAVVPLRKLRMMLVQEDLNTFRSISSDNLATLPCTNDRVRHVVD